MPRILIPLRPILGVLQTSKAENVLAKMLCGLDQQMEKKEDNGLYFRVPLVGDVRTLFMDEAHASRYSVKDETSETFGYVATATDT
ncbi:hypothetical protein Tco_0028728 [Tanacetum coccineum]